MSGETIVMAGARVSINRSYVWHADGYAALMSALQDAGRELFGVETSFRGSFNSGAGVRLEFDDAVAMGGQLPAVPKDFDACINSRDWHGRIAVNHLDRDKPLRVDISVAAAEQERALAAVAALEQRLQLKSLPDYRTPDAPKVSVEREFRGQALMPTQFIQQIEALVGPLLTPYAFSGEVSARKANSPRYRYEDKSRLLAALPSGIGELRIELARHGDYASFSATLDCKRSSPEVRLRANVRAEDVDAIQSAIGQLQLALVLQPWVRHGDTPLSSLRCTGFTMQRLNKAWFIDFCKLIRQHYTNPFYMNAAMRSQTEADCEHSWNTLEEWERHVVDEWEKVLELRLSLNTDTARLWIYLEPKFDFIRLEPAEPSTAQAQTQLDMLVSKLNVELVSEEPYMQLKTERTFALSWNRSAFVEAIRAVVPQFLGASPQLVTPSTYVAEDDGKGSSVLTSFSTLDEYCERLLSDKPQSGNKLVAKGPRGKIMAIETNDNCRRLVVRSSFEIGTFNDLIRSLQEHLQLNEPARSAKSSNELTTWQQIWRLDGLMGKIVALLLGGIVATAGTLAERLIASDTIELLQPRSPDNNPVAIASGCRVVEWKIIEKRPFDDGRESVTEIGNVRLTDHASGKRQVVDHFQSGSELFFPPGEWDVDVFDPVRGRVSKVVVVKASATTSAKNAVLSTCGP